MSDSLWKLTTLLKIRIEAKKIYRVLEINNQSQWLKQYVEINTKNRTEVAKYGDKDRKVICLN